MIKSMTGYGREQSVVDGMNITVEIKSVNHRFFEFSSKLPRNYGFLDEKLKSYFMGRITRGKLECYVSIETVEEPDVLVAANEPLIRSYLDAYREIEEKFGLENDIKVSDIVRAPDALTIRKQAADEEKIWLAVQQVADAAVKKFLSMRETEGERLRADIDSRLDTIIDCVSFVEQRSPETVREYNEKLLARLNELLSGAGIDEQRILTEAIGKKMDFLVQEMNRETNTIGSKANDVQIARTVVDLKAEIEKIREQIQNIE